MFVSMEHQSSHGTKGLLFQEVAYKSLLDYLKAPMDSSSSQQCLCLCGPPGVGKSMLMERAAQELNRRLVIFSDEEDFDLKAIVRSSSLFGPFLLVVDEPTESVAVEDLVKARAVILTTSLYEGPMKTLRSKVKTVFLHVYTKQETSAIVQSLFPVSPAIADTVAEQCAPDIRYASTMLSFAVRTAKAKKARTDGASPSSLLAPHDVEFDLFRDVNSAFRGRTTTGVGSGDFFLYETMLQTNCVVRTKKLLRVLDGFCNLDVAETALVLPVDSLIDTTSSLTRLCFESSAPLVMPRIANPGKRLDLLREASRCRDTSIVCFERLLAMEVPSRITKKHELYHENADVRAIMKSPWKQ
jgi:hypothetical protein